MSDRDDLDHFPAFIIFFVLLVVAVMFVLHMWNHNGDQEYRAIEMEKAYYDSKTGDFKWSDNVSKYIFTGEK